MPYQFQWAVNAPEFGNDYSHQQSSDGRLTQGEYRVLLPDSRVQIVRFTADENGYVADVQYEGTAVFPQAQASNVNAVRTRYNQQQQQYAAPAQQQQQYSAPAQQQYAAPTQQQQYSGGQQQQYGGGQQQQYNQQQRGGYGNQGR